jgi:glycosyltransferase involved in cell wall biosynthesis
MKYLQDIPVKVAITGDREDCDIKLANLIKRFNLEKKVEYLGFQNGKYLNKIISEAMCVACPAIWYENLPNAILEAYSFGKPVIASNLGSLSEIVEDKKTGLLFNPKDVEQIASCIRILYEDPVFCVALGQNARAKCEKEYSPDLHWSNFIEIYRRAMKNYD